MPTQSDSTSLTQRLQLREASVPAITYPPELPVSAARNEIMAAIRAAQVVVIAGETGSGKTTQLPKMCLELGRGVRGLIGHTQPRRIAARSVAERIAEELGVDLGKQVGYQVRFADRSSAETLLKVMTDGVLLTDIQRDRKLTAYDTIILDEAHERSLNIDFLLGYLHQLLPQRPDLKLIITSATIDPERFARHFHDAPIIEVSGRTYPVEVRYQPVNDPERPHADDRDQVQAIVDAVDELSSEGPGDILVFLSGEREIRDTADALRALKLRDTEVTPLYARLSSAEQYRVFQPHSGRRIVLATNVAETSLTVPGIRYVVDPGTARISRYSNRTKVQRLPVEPISQASANQRKGRCGRVAEGICIRLYSEDDFLARPEFTDPEILRTNLASVILQMTALGLGDVGAFGFLDPPDQRSVRDAVQLLHELHAIDDDSERPQHRLTEVGRALARLPVDPRLGRMLVEADRSGCLREVLVITAALSIQDPRERPAEQQGAADESHARFSDERSDFLAWLNLWEYLRAQQRALSSNQFRRQCRAEFLHYLRIREWQDLHSQLRRSAKNLGMSVNDSPAEPEVVHRALLAGLLSHIGLRQPDSRDYVGARNARFVLWPGSVLARKPPAWIMAGELVETSRLWARTAAGIQPEWAEQLGEHLVKRSYSEPRWSTKHGAAVAEERVTLYGVPVVTARTVPYGRVDPETSRALFLRHALVQGEWRTQHRFVRANRELLAQLEDLEDRTRRRDLVVDDDTVLAFYDARIPAHVVSARHFDSWWKRKRKRDPDLLTLTEDLLLARDEGTAVVSRRDFPDQVSQGEATLALRYRFAPGAADDGVTVDVPLPVLNQLLPSGFDWQVPGLREELVTALVRSLPKDLRRRFVPVPDVVREVLTRLQPSGEPLVAALARELQALRGVPVPPGAFALERLPAHLRMGFRVVDGKRVVASGKDLAALQRDLAPDMQQAVAETAEELEQHGARTWSFGTLPRTVQRVRNGHQVQGFPALVDEGESVGVRVLLAEAEQRRAMWFGVRRLLLLTVPPPLKAVHDRLDHQARLVLTRNPHGSVPALLSDCAAAAIESLMLGQSWSVWDDTAFANLRRIVETGYEQALTDVVTKTAKVLAAAHAVEGRLVSLPQTTSDPSVDDIRRQRARMLFPGFVSATGRRRLPDLVRYLRAIERRADKLREDPGRDRSLLAVVAVVQEEYEALLRRNPAAVNDEPVRAIRWMIEELRVNLFAQSLGTAYPISDQRIFKAIAKLG